MFNRFVEENSEFSYSENLLNQRFQQLFSLNMFTMAWLENFWISSIWNTLKWRISTAFSLRVCSPWLKKILIFKVLKCLRMNHFSNFFYKMFTRVEENFKFRYSAMPQNEQFWTIFRAEDGGWVFDLSFTVWVLSFTQGCTHGQYPFHPSSIMACFKDWV